jgi:hypothetical protein
MQTINKMRRRKKLQQGVPGKERYVTGLGIVNFI